MRSLAQTRTWLMAFHQPAHSGTQISSRAPPLHRLTVDHGVPHFFKKELLPIPATGKRKNADTRFCKTVRVAALLASAEFRFLLYFTLACAFQGPTGPSKLNCLDRLSGMRLGVNLGLGQHRRASQVWPTHHKVCSDHFGVRESRTLCHPP